MKLTKVTNTILFTLLVSLATVGCKHTKMTTKLDGPSSQKKSITPSIEGSGTLVQNGDGPISTEMKDPTNGLPTGPGHRDWTTDPDIFKAFTVHFDYDSSVLKPAEKPHVEALASELKSNPGWALRVDGHCDERGTEEYNRSLGERRALALREELVRLGVESARVDTMSFGNDKPLVKGHDDVSYAQNRRGEFVQLTQPK